MKPPRTPWQSFPDALLLATEQRTRQHPDYAAAKRGRIAAAVTLVADLVIDADVAAVRSLVRTTGAENAVLVAVQALEDGGFNDHAVFKPRSGTSASCSYCPVRPGRASYRFGPRMLSGASG